MVSYEKKNAKNVRKVPEQFILAKRSTDNILMWKLLNSFAIGSSWGDLIKRVFILRNCHTRTSAPVFSEGIFSTVSVTKKEAKKAACLFVLAISGIFFSVLFRNELFFFLFILDLGNLHKSFSQPGGCNMASLWINRDFALRNNSTRSGIGNSYRTTRHSAPHHSLKSDYRMKATYEFARPLTTTTPCDRECFLGGSGNTKRMFFCSAISTRRNNQCFV